MTRPSRAKADKADLFAAYWNVGSADAIAPVREYRFDPVRRWRFDFAWPAQRVAVEVEGNAWHVRGGGRHMQDADLEKYNAAAFAGWRVFRFSPGMLNRDPLGCVYMVRMAIRQDGWHPEPGTEYTHAVRIEETGPNTHTMIYDRISCSQEYGDGIPVPGTFRVHECPDPLAAHLRPSAAEMSEDE